MAGEVPTMEEFERMVEAVRRDLPTPFRGYLDGVVVRVQDFPDVEIQAHFALDSPFDLLGLYQGVDMLRKGATPDGEPDYIFLYRRPILAAAAEGDDSLAAWIRHVFIHEAGHHFGLSDAEMEAIEQDADD